MACEEQLRASLPSSAFSDVRLVPRNWRWWECLQHRNYQALHIRPSPHPQPVVKHFPAHHCPNVSTRIPYSQEMLHTSYTGSLKASTIHRVIHILATSKKKYFSHFCISLCGHNCFDNIETLGPYRGKGTWNVSSPSPWSIQSQAGNSHLPRRRSRISDILSEPFPCLSG